MFCKHWCHTFIDNAKCVCEEIFDRVRVDERLVFKLQKKLKQHANKKLTKLKPVVAGTLVQKTVHSNKSPVEGSKDT